MEKKVNYYSDNLDFLINQNKYMLKEIIWVENSYYAGGYKQYIFIKGDIELSIDLKHLYNQCLKLDTKFNNYLLELNNGK